MYKGKLDAREASIDNGTEYVKKKRKFHGTHLSSSDSFAMGTPVCMVCMRNT
jgi:hypothetical protein